MACNTHSNHEHKHSSDCGHKAIQHDGHVDYLHDNHLHNVHADHIDEHSISESSNNKSECTPDHICSTHDKAHVHGPKCGHETVPHNGHTDYLVGNHLHHPCHDHCDHHGAVAVA